MPSAAANEQKYVLTSVDRADPPEGMEGDDWYQYSIAQGDNVIVGFRRGKVRAVKTELKALVDGLNERRAGKPRGRPQSTTNTSAAAKADPKTSAKSDPK